MPNGGSDCCGNCRFNRAVQELGEPAGNHDDHFWASSFCTLRDVKITKPFWTYCDNYFSPWPPEPGKAEEPIGWIYASGLYEGYVRIPWHDKTEPCVSIPCVCRVCGRQTDQGITVTHEGTEIGFCTNRHYVDWWKTKHDDPEISSDDFDPPEECYRDRS